MDEYTMCFLVGAGVMILTLACLLGWIAISRHYCGFDHLSGYDHISLLKDAVGMFMSLPKDDGANGANGVGVANNVDRSHLASDALVRRLVPLNEKPSGKGPENA
jgi:hypothetical protein